MNRTFTDITILIDRSGSMKSIKEEMETALDFFIKEHRQNPSTRVTLIDFDTVNPQRIVFQSVPVTHVEPIILDPRGGTPLIDSLCEAIDNTGTRYRELPESKRPSQVLFVVITDGEENASRKHTRKDVFNRVTKQTNDYKWQFTFLGANQDAIREAQTYGFLPQFALTYGTDAASLNNAMRSLSRNTMSFASAQSVSMDAYDDDQRKQANLTNQGANDVTNTSR